MTQRTILLVEDNEADEAFALRAFRKNGVTAHIAVARDGQEALEYLFDASNPLPAFVLLDLKLPKVSGLDVLKQLRANARTGLVPVIVLTSSTRDADLRASYALGGNSFVVKSIDFERFGLELGALARFWLDVNKPADGQ
jgi:two-component system response regulator